MKKAAIKAEKLGEAVVLGLFVLVGAISSLSLLGFVNVSDTAQTVLGYAIGAFAAIVFGQIVWKSVQN